MESILLVGAGGHAHACIDVIEQGKQYTIAGLVGLPDEVGSKVLGYPIVGTDIELPALSGEFAHVLIALGQIKTPEPRMRLFEKLLQSGCGLPIIVSPYAYVSPHARLGAGSIVMHGAVINAGAVIGQNCIINSQALVEHDAIIEDHCHIATATVINGGVRIGAGSFVGSGSRVKQGVVMGERCLIGMGQLVLSNCEAEFRMPSPRNRHEDIDHR
jgi:sugar O-acyltransferase (sialic acid O-acetyltransferase NeuD family)